MWGWCKQCYGERVTRPSETDTQSKKRSTEPEALGVFSHMKTALKIFFWLGK